MSGSTDSVRSTVAPVFPWMRSHDPLAQVVGQRHGRDRLHLEAAPRRGATRSCEGAGDLREVGDAAAVDEHLEEVGRERVRALGRGRRRRPSWRACRPRGSSSTARSSADSSHRPRRTRRRPPATASTASAVGGRLEEGLGVGGRDAHAGVPPPFGAAGRRRQVGLVDAPPRSGGGGRRRSALRRDTFSAASSASVTTSSRRPLAAARACASIWTSASVSTRSRWAWACGDELGPWRSPSLRPCSRSRSASLRASARRTR